MKMKMQPCLKCFGKGKYEGTHGRTVCGSCDGTGKVNRDTRKMQLKERRELIKKLTP